MTLTRKFGIYYIPLLLTLLWIGLYFKVPGFIFFTTLFCLGASCFYTFKSIYIFGNIEKKSDSDELSVEGNMEYDNFFTAIISGISVSHFLFALLFFSMKWPGGSIIINYSPYPLLLSLILMFIRLKKKKDDKVDFVNFTFMLLVTCLNFCCLYF